MLLLLVTAGLAVVPPLLAGSTDAEGADPVAAVAVNGIGVAPIVQRPAAGPEDQTRTTTVAGGTVALGPAPPACVPVGGSFSAVLAFADSRGKGSAVVRVDHVDFFVDGERTTTDRRPPFGRRLTVRGLATQASHTFRARATMRVRRGKRPTKSISTTVAVCR